MTIWVFSVSKVILISINPSGFSSYMEVVFQLEAIWYIKTGFELQAAVVETPLDVALSILIRFWCAFMENVGFFLEHSLESIPSECEKNFKAFPKFFPFHPI